MEGHEIQESGTAGQRRFVYTAGLVAAETAADLSAIFGAGQPEAGPISRRPPIDRGRVLRRHFALSASVIGVSAAILLGYAGGNGAIADVSAEPKSTLGAFHPAVKSHKVVDARSTILRSNVSGLHLSATDTPQSKSKEAGHQPTRGTSPAHDIVATPLARPDIVVPSRQSAAVAPVTTPNVVSIARADDAPANRFRRVCNDDSEACLSERIAIADHDLASAYGAASEAGARARDLRDYRKLWTRARRQAISRPAEALQLYDMVTADLDTLTEDATGSPGSVVR